MSKVRVVGASTSLAIVAVLAFLLPASAQPAAPVAVKIIYSDATIAVQTLQNAPLTAVLEEFCRQTRTDCEGTGAAANIELPPINAVGTWEQVIANLMEGTNLNYAAMPATTASGARLLIAARARTLETPQPASVTNRADGRVPSSAGDSLNAGSSGAALDTSGAQEVAAAEDTTAELGPIQEPIAASVASDAASINTATLSPLNSVNSGVATDLTGNPVPHYAGPADFPFPDGNGNPIVADHQPTSSPFADPNGNLSADPELTTPNVNPFPPSHRSHTEPSR